MEEKILVMITAGTEDEGAKIAKVLLEAHLIACANLVGGIRSLYRWEGKVCDDPEILLLCKTVRKHLSALSEKVKSIHSYDVPEIIAFPIEGGWRPYLDWLEQETAPA